MKIFLLRFEEQKVASIHDLVVDPQTVVRSRWPKLSKMAGTQTVTEAEAGVNDTDPVSHSARVLPIRGQTPFLVRFDERSSDHKATSISAGTLTITNVKAEATDSDPARRSFNVFAPIQGGQRPQPTQEPTFAADFTRYAQPSLATQTRTTIKTQESDQNPLSKQLDTIPRCSSS